MLSIIVIISAIFRITNDFLLAACRGMDKGGARILILQKFVMKKARIFFLRIDG